MAKTFSEIQVRISANMAELGRAVNRASADLRKFNADINKLTGFATAAFSVDRVVDFTKEIVLLSGKAEGVAGAFNKLPNSIGLMNDLRIATKGTISDFELMQRTVQAFNLGIGLKEFPKLLEFATVRAQQTGEEIDYIVQSLVEGIGRKSVLKLDNLGISAERLRKQLNGVSLEASSIAQVTAAFGAIADEELKNMGSLAETAATKIDRLSSAWTDFKVKLGDVAEKGISPVAEGATGLLNIFSSENLTGLEKFKVLIEALTAGANPLNAFQANLVLARAEATDFFKELEKAEFSNKAAKDATDAFNEALKQGKTASEAATFSLDKLNLVIDEYDKEINRAISIRKPEKEIQKLRDQLNLLTKSWTSTNDELRKTANANVIKNKIDADAEAVENLIEKLKDYDRILRTFKIQEPFRLIADVTTGQIFKLPKPKETPSKKPLERLGIGDSTGQVKSIEQLFGSDVAKGIDEIVRKAKEAIAAFEKLKKVTASISESFTDAAQQGLSDFLTGLGDVAAGTVSFGDNIIRAVTGFMKQFGAQLIKISAGYFALGNIPQGIAALTAGTALGVAAGSISRSMQQRTRGIGTGWGGNQNMTGNSGFETGFNMGNQNITITGRLVGSGRDLVAVIDNTYFDNSMRKGG